MIKKLLLPTILAGVMITGCSGTDCCMPSIISVSPSSLTLSGAQDSKNVTISCPVNWTLYDVVPAWLAITPASGHGADETVSVTIIDGKDVDRKGIVSFMASNGDKVILTVNQKAQNSEENVPHTPAIYVAGRDGDWHAVLWIDQIAHFLPKSGAPERSEARSVFVTDDGHVYVSGDQESPNAALLWIDQQEPIVLPDPNNLGMFLRAASLYVTDQKIYVAGGAGFNAFLWILDRANNDDICIIPLTNGLGFSKNSVYVTAEEDVYVVGVTMSGQPVLWILKKGTSSLTTLSLEGSTPWIDAQIGAASDGTIYITGTNNNKALLWSVKGGVVEHTYIFSEVPIFESLFVDKNDGVHLIGSPYGPNPLLYIRLTQPQIEQNILPSSLPIELTRVFSLFATDDGTPYIAGKYQTHLYDEAAFWSPKENLQFLPQTPGRWSPYAYSIVVK
ncbi:MAG: hypothetical protein FWG54_06670 [Bacteroidetes bacterium]|nr:hypothetical protein [Bacteroidota bacterium]